MAFGVVAMAGTLPLLALPTRVVWATGALVLVNVAYGFLVNPTLSELADAVDRTGSGAYASVYAIYNVAYAAGTIGSDAGAGVLASALSFQASLCGVSLVLLASLLLLTVVRGRSTPGAGTPTRRQA
jgi:hypothetical protein